MPYGYEPLNYVPRYGGIAQGISTAVGGAAQGISQYAQAKEQVVKDQKMTKDLVNTARQTYIDLLVDSGASVMEATRDVNSRIAIKEGDTPDNVMKRIEIASKSLNAQLETHKKRGEDLRQAELGRSVRNSIGEQKRAPTLEESQFGPAPDVTIPRAQTKQEVGPRLDPQLTTEQVGTVPEYATLPKDQSALDMADYMKKKSVRDDEKMEIERMKIALREGSQSFDHYYKTQKLQLDKMKYFDDPYENQVAQSDKKFTLASNAITAIEKEKTDAKNGIGKYAYQDKAEIDSAVRNFDSQIAMAKSDLKVAQNQKMKAYNIINEMQGKITGENGTSVVRAEGDGAFSLTRENTTQAPTLEPPRSNQSRGVTVEPTGNAPTTSRSTSSTEEYRKRYNY